MKRFEIIKDSIILADNARYYDSFFFKARGLMFSMPLKNGEALILVADGEGILETTIHMLFVFFPIDIVWLDSNYSVVDKKENVIPFIPWISPKKPAKYVIELRNKTAKHIKIGDKLIFKKR